MAIFTRINGDAAGQVSVDAGRSFANAAIINLGIAAPLSAYKITFPNGNLAAELTTGGAVETVVRYIESNATVLAYQVDASGSGTELSVLTERTGWTSDTALQNFIVAQVSQSTGTYYANVTASNVWVGGGFAVSSAGGLKLA